MNYKRREKLGDWTLDIAKYVFTAVIIARWFSKAGDWKWFDYIIPLVVVIATISWGLYLTGKDDDKIKEEKNNNNK